MTLSSQNPGPTSLPIPVSNQPPCVYPVSPGSRKERLRKLPGRNREKKNRVHPEPLWGYGPNEKEFSKGAQNPNSGLVGHMLTFLEGAFWRQRPSDPLQSKPAKSAQRDRNTGSWWLLHCGQGTGRWRAPASWTQEPGPRTMLFLGYR